MYEPEKILVQNAGIDPGVAALLQNANKGNMDPAALMAMMNNGGFGGNGGWWWIWIILMMKLCRKVSFQYQDRTDVNQSMYLLVVMENLRNYQYQLNVQ